MLKYLRIAVTALCLTACVLLIALWVRSYSRFDSAIVPLTSSSFVASTSSVGRVGLDYTSVTTARMPADVDSVIWNTQVLTDLELEYFYPAARWSWLYVNDNSGMTVRAVLPHWFPLILTFVLAAVPWIHCSRRFSLRTLLIATTLVAVALGVMIYLAR
jgi:hypothetical protein